MDVCNGRTTARSAAVIIPIVVAHEVSRRVLLAVAGAYPEPNRGAITSVEIMQARDGAVHVDITHTSADNADGSFEDQQLSCLRSAVSDALGPWRHTVRTIEMVT